MSNCDGSRGRVRVFFFQIGFVARADFSDGWVEKQVVLGSNFAGGIFV